MEDRCLLSVANIVQTNLVSDISGMAVNPPSGTPDSNLVNPWGLAAGPSGDFWVADNGTGVSTLYDGTGTPAGLVVTIPANPNDPAGTHGTPTGIVFNTDANGFNVTEGQNTGSAAFIFDTLDGTISAWNPNVDLTNAILAVHNTGSVYTGLAIGVDKAGDTNLYAADFSKGTIDVFNSNFQSVTNLAGNFKDSRIPSDYRPFNIQNINGNLYVEYAKINPSTGKLDPDPGSGHGFVDIFNTDGQHIKLLVAHNSLDQPWGVTLAPANFGQFSNDLLVGNFGDGHINVFDPKNGNFISQLNIAPGNRFAEDDLWALAFGNGNGAGSTNQLFFNAGINDEKDGLFGSLQGLTQVSQHNPLLPNLSVATTQTFSTVPATTGDLNPYGIAFAPAGLQGSGSELQAGDLLVSNFNNSSNVQGTGSTIMRFTPDGQSSVFFQGTPGLGLTTALAVLKNGYVIVGSLPADPNTGSPTAGSLLILDRNGNVVLQLSNATLLNGPWDLAVNDHGGSAQVFVANVLSGTVTRINLSTPSNGHVKVQSMTQIASGYQHQLDPNAFVIGPTGLAFDPHRNILYVASTGDNEVFAIPNAANTNTDHGTGSVIFTDPTDLHGPLGLLLAPNGDLIAANGDAINTDPNHLNELTEFTPTGTFVSQFQVDTGAAGGAFGVAVSTDGGVERFAAVDDVTNSVTIFTLGLNGH